MGHESLKLLMSRVSYFLWVESQTSYEERVLHFLCKSEGGFYFRRNGVVYVLWRLESNISSEVVGLKRTGHLNKKILCGCTGYRLSHRIISHLKLYERCLLKIIHKAFPTEEILAYIIIPLIAPTNPLLHSPFRSI